MAEPTKYLEKSWHKRSDEAQERVFKAIRDMQAGGEPINFNTVHVKSGAMRETGYGGTNEESGKKLAQAF